MDIFKTLKTRPSVNYSLIIATFVLSCVLIIQAFVKGNPELARITSGPAPHNLVIVAYLFLILALGGLSKYMLKPFIIVWGVVGMYELYLTIYWDITRYWVNVGYEQVVIYSSYILIIYLSLRWWPQTRIAFIGLFLFMGVIESGFESWAFNLHYHSTLAPSTSPATSPYFLNVIDNSVEIINVCLACSIFFICYWLAWKRLRIYDIE